jgi:hypothetical protein
MYDKKGTMDHTIPRRLYQKLFQSFHSQAI